MASHLRDLPSECCRHLLFFISRVASPNRSQLHPDARPLALEVESTAANAVGLFSVLSLLKALVPSVKDFFENDLPKDKSSQFQNLSLYKEPT